MLKQEKLPSTNSTKSGDHLNFAKNRENEHTPGFARPGRNTHSDVCVINCMGLAGKL